MLDRIGDDTNAVVCCCLHVPFQPVRRPLTVATFAVAYSLIRHSAEVKPYGSDVFVTLVVLTLTVE